MLENESQTHQRRAPFGLWSATCLVVANMIGAGVFTTSGFSFVDLGERHYVMLAWLIGSLIAICGAISYGQLAQRIAESGGEYLFLSRLVHPAVGFIAGWVSLLAGFTGAIAFAAAAFESYGIPPSMRPDWFRPGMAAVTAIVLFGLLHSIKLKVGVLTQNAVVIFKLVLLAAFISASFASYPTRWEGLQVETESAELTIYALASTLVWISLSFSGFNAAIYITGEVEEPQKNVPRSLLMGTLLVSFLYLGLNFIFIYGPAPDDIKAVPDVAIAASQAIGGDALALLIRVIVSVALLSSISSMVVAGPRVYAKMAEDHLLPRLFGVSGPNQSAVPASAIWLQTVLASVVVWFSTLKSLLDYLGFTLSISAAMTVACVFWSRRESQTSLRHLFFATIALIYVLATLLLAALAAVNRPQQLIGFAVTVASGLVLFCLFKWLSKNRNSNESQPKTYRP